MCSIPLKLLQEKNILWENFLQSMCQQLHLNLSNEFLMLWNGIELEICIAVALFCIHFAATAVYICIEMK